MADVALRVAASDTRAYGDASEFDVWCAFAGADLRARPPQGVIVAAPAGAPPDTIISPAGIPSAEAFGTPTLTLTVSPAGIASAEAFGTPMLTLVISPTGIPSAEAFGTPTISAAPAAPTAPHPRSHRTRPRLRGRPR